MTEELVRGAAVTRRRIRGYLPCRLVTNRENKAGKVLVQFEDGARMWFDAAKVDRA